MICRKTMGECPTPSMCAPFQGCEPAPQPAQTGWRCPVCGTGNAPWASTCGNVMCGKNSWEITCEVKQPSGGGALPLTFDSAPSQPTFKFTPLKTDDSQVPRYPEQDGAIKCDQRYDPLTGNKLMVTTLQATTREEFEQAQDKALEAIRLLEQERKIDPADLHRPLSEFPK